MSKYEVLAKALEDIDIKIKNEKNDEELKKHNETREALLWAMKRIGK